MQLLDKFRAIMRPDVPRDVMRHMDAEGMQGMCYATKAVALVVAVCLVLFLATLQQYDESSVLTAISMGVCCLCCLVGYAVSHAMIRRNAGHRAAVAFNVVIFAALSAWSVVVSYWRYTMGAQMFTFFMVVMMAMCFIVCRPWLAVALMGGAYGLLYAAIYQFDGAAHMNSFNYAVLMLLSMVGMVVRFHVELKASQKSAELEYVGRHDELTGLLNRKALEEDTPELVGGLCVHLIDLNYFKEINDTYGHLTGDHVLRETAKFLHELFSTERIYRFGGDEFLVVETSPSETAVDDLHELAISFEGLSFVVTLCIGCAKGEVATESELDALIIEADKAMYIIKERSHLPHR